MVGESDFAPAAADTFAYDITAAFQADAELASSRADGRYFDGLTQPGGRGRGWPALPCRPPSASVNLTGHSSHTVVGTSELTRTFSPR